MTADIFETFGDSLLSKPVKRMREQEARRATAKAARAAVPPMVKRGLEEKQEKKAKQLIRYRRWKAEVREGMSRGDYGPEIIDLFKFLRKRNQDIFGYVMTAKWLLRCNEDVRITLLSYIDDSLVRNDIRGGWPPFNDALPGEPLNAFQTIRKHLTGV